MEKKKRGKVLIYKQWTFWVMLVSILFNLFFMLAIGGYYQENMKLENKLANSTVTKTSDTINDPQNLLTEEQEQMAIEEMKETKNDKILNFKTVAKFQSGQEIIVNSIKQDTIKTLSDEHLGKKPVVANVTIKNATKEPIDLNVQIFTAYDKNGTDIPFDSRTYAGNVPHTIAAGKNTTVDILYAADNDGPYSISFGDIIWE